MTHYVKTSYYQTLKPLVLNVVKHYQTDFIKHDKKDLRGYKGELVLGYRPTGTYLFKLDDGPEMLKHWEKYFIDCHIKDGNCLRYNFVNSFYYQSIVGVIGNTHFIHGLSNTIWTIKKADAEAIMMNFFEKKLYPYFNGLPYSETINGFFHSGTLR